MERKRKRRWAGLHSAGKLAEGALAGATAAQRLVDSERGDKKMQLEAAHQAQGIASLMALASLLVSFFVVRFFSPRYQAWDHRV